MCSLLNPGAISDPSLLDLPAEVDLESRRIGPNVVCTSSRLTLLGNYVKFRVDIIPSVL